MITLGQIREGIRAKYFLPEITIRVQGTLAGTSHQSMMRLNNRCRNMNIDHLVAESLSDSELLKKLYPRIVQPVSNKRQPDLDAIVTELTKSRGKRKTRTVLYLEYRAVNPSTALSRTHFFRAVNKVLKRCKLSMKQLHVAGDVVYIDYAGRQVFYRKSGNKIWCKVFVAVLGASKKLFAWATYGEKTEHWIDGMARMFVYFEGVTSVVSMDNATALVARPGLLAHLTQNVEAFGHHYNCLMDTCRVGKPQDKSHAELGVKFVTNRILVPMMQNHTFFSLEDINQHLVKEVEQLNEAVFQGLNISRNDLFKLNEKSALRPLPSESYKMVVDRLRQKVPLNYHIKYLKHEYSVPYQLRGETVDIIVDQTDLRVIFEHKEVAKHRVKNEPLGATTTPAHMPAEHIADASQNDSEKNLAWARKTGSAVEKLVLGWYGKTANSKSRVIGKRCHALMQICNKNGASVLAEACEYAELHGMSSPSDISLIISANKHEDGFDNLPVFNIAHQNVRGAEYFGGHHEA